MSQNNQKLEALAKRIGRSWYPAGTLYDEVAEIVLSATFKAVAKCREASVGRSACDWSDFSGEILIYFSSIAISEIEVRMPLDLTSDGLKWPKFKTALLSVEKTDCDQGDEKWRKSVLSNDMFDLYRNGHLRSRQIPNYISNILREKNQSLPERTLFERREYALVSRICLLEEISTVVNEIPDNVARHWEVIQKECEEFRSNLRSLFQSAGRRQRRNLLLVTGFAVACYVCLGTQRDLALAPDGHPIGVLANIRQVVQGQDFWQTQLYAVRSELASTERYIVDLAGLLQKLEGARNQSSAAVAQWEAQQLARRPETVGKVVANKLRREADRIEEEFGEAILFNTQYRESAERLNQLRALELIVLKKLAPEQQ